MYYKDYDFNNLLKIRNLKKQGFRKGTYNNCFIGMDTETSKKEIGTDNHIVAFSIAIRADHENICSIYGHDPNEMLEALYLIREKLSAHDIYIYFHNLAYDWVFIRKFFMNAFGEPVKQLNTKSHNPICIEFDNGIILKDSLILAACKLEKWAKNLDVEHQKAVGFWEYDKIRHQKNLSYTEKEVLYIENDVLALVECLDKTAEILHKFPFSMPYTNTGIVRDECKKIGKKNRAHAFFEKIAPDFQQLDMMMFLFHGGYTHGNRYFYNSIILSKVVCLDFASSYPFCMLAYKFPMTRFCPTDDLSIDQILELSDKYAFMFKLILIKPDLKDRRKTPMPVLQYSKCVKAINPELDNGRILSADYIEIYITELDLDIINRQYTYIKHICTEIQFSIKRYLPRWFTDYIFDLFVEKSKLKGKDKINYGIAKSKLNSCYGMTVQKPLKDDLVENYGTGDFEIEEKFNEENYNKYLKKQSSILPYQWGVWVTAYALRNLFDLGECVDYNHYGEWLYSDTDSIYAYNWDQKKVDAYNERCKELLKANGYGAAVVDGKEYWLGIATEDKVCKEFIYQGSKRYAYRDDEGLHITVAGVPKSGKSCLKDDINNFTKGFCFDGITTGKKEVVYNFVDDIYVDRWGDITGDSIDLRPCDYILDSESHDEYYQEGMTLEYVYE